VELAVTVPDRGWAFLPNMTKWWNRFWRIWQIFLWELIFFLFINLKAKRYVWWHPQKQIHCLQLVVNLRRLSWWSFLEIAGKWDWSVLKSLARWVSLLISESFWCTCPSFIVREWKYVTAYFQVTSTQTVWRMTRYLWRGWHSDDRTSKQKCIITGTSEY
jgi:hypothetical protein